MSKACCRVLLGFIGGLVFSGICGGPVGAYERFIRGDVNANGKLNVSDPVLLLRYLFLDGSIQIPCQDAADADANGRLDLRDGILILEHLFLGTGNLRHLIWPINDPRPFVENFLRDLAEMNGGTFTKILR